MSDLELLPVPAEAPDDAVPADGARVEFRPLAPEEIETLKSVFEENGAELPNPETSFILGAVEDGKVVGFLTVQLAVHAEPMWIAQGRQHLFRSIVNAAERTIVSRVGVCDVYLFAPAGRVAQMAQTVGMRVEPWVVLSKRVGAPIEEIH